MRLSRLTVCNVSNTQIFLSTCDDCSFFCARMSAADAPPLPSIAPANALRKPPVTCHNQHLISMAAMFWCTLLQLHLFALFSLAHSIRFKMNMPNLVVGSTRACLFSGTSTKNFLSFKNRFKKSHFRECATHNSSACCIIGRVFLHFLFVKLLETRHATWS